MCVCGGGGGGEGGIRHFSLLPEYLSDLAFGIAASAAWQPLQRAAFAQIAVGFPAGKIHSATTRSSSTLRLPRQHLTHPAQTTPNPHLTIYTITAKATCNKHVTRQP